MMGDKKHATFKKIGLDKWKILKVSQCDWAHQQLPLCAMCPVRINQLFWVSQEVEVVIFIHLSAYTSKNLCSAFVTADKNVFLKYCHKGYSFISTVNNFSTFTFTNEFNKIIIEKNGKTLKLITKKMR